MNVPGNFNPKFLKEEAAGEAYCAWRGLTVSDCSAQGT
jgi:hypothetical protein